MIKKIRIVGLTASDVLLGVAMRLLMEINLFLLINP